MNKKIRIENKMLDIKSEEEFIKDKETFNNTFTAIEHNGIAYPLRSSNDCRAGVYDYNWGLIYVNPPENEKAMYDVNNAIDFQNISDIRDVIEAQSKYKNEERVILTTKDNIFKPEIKPNDAPEMVALKQAIINKQIDIEKYEQRFSPNFNNDKRLLRKNSITLSKIKSIADALDLVCTLTIEDLNDQVPNPMGTKISVKLNRGIGEEEE